MRSYKLFLIAFTIIGCLCVSVMPQNPAPLGIKPEPPEGKGLVALRAARLIDGAGAAPINNAIVIVTNNRITAVGDAASVRVPSGAKVIAHVQTPSTKPVRFVATDIVVLPSTSTFFG